VCGAIWRDSGKFSSPGGWRNSASALALVVETLASLGVAGAVGGREQYSSRFSPSAIALHTLNTLKRMPK